MQTKNNENQLQCLADAMLADIKELASQSKDPCKYCKHYIPCLGKECKCYVEGTEAWDQKGCKLDWQWSCMDFKYGECEMLENTPCNGCMTNKLKGFEWRGII